MITSLAHNGLPKGVSRFQLIALAKRVARSDIKTERISRTAITVLEHYISGCREDDFRSGRICGVWEQPSTVAATLGISTRVLHNAEAELRDKGLIERTSMPHARRYGERKNGIIAILSGINLGPMVEIYPHLVATLAAIEERKAKAAILRAEIGQCRRLIWTYRDPDMMAKADWIVPGGRTSTINKIDALERILEKLRALLDSENQPTGPKKSDNETEEIFPPNILERNLDKNRSLAARVRRRRKEAEFIGPDAAAALASEDYRFLFTNAAKPNWRTLVEASAAASGWLGISQKMWGQACDTMGRETAALCILVIDRNCRLPSAHRYHARSPAQCLRGMIVQFRNGLLNINAMLRACAHDEEDAGLPDLPPPRRCDYLSVGFIARRVIAH